MEAALERIEARLPAGGEQGTAAALARIEDRLEALERREDPAAAPAPDARPASGADEGSREDQAGAPGAVRALARRLRCSR